MRPELDPACAPSSSSRTASCRGRARCSTGSASCPGDAARLGATAALRERARLLDAVGRAASPELRPQLGRGPGAAARAPAPRGRAPGWSADVPLGVMLSRRARLEPDHRADGRALDPARADVLDRLRRGRRRERARRRPRVSPSGSGTDHHELLTSAADHPGAARRGAVASRGADRRRLRASASCCSAALARESSRSRCRARAPTSCSAATASTRSRRGDIRRAGSAAAAARGAGAGARRAPEARPLRRGLLAVSRPTTPPTRLLAMSRVRPARTSAHELLSPELSVPGRRGGDRRASSGAHCAPVPPLEPARPRRSTSTHASRSSTTCSSTSTRCRWRRRSRSACRSWITTWSRSARACRTRAASGASRRKELLKRASRGLVDDAIIDKPKRGFFHSALGAWLRRHRDALVRETLLDGRAARARPVPPRGAAGADRRRRGGGKKPASSCSACCCWSAGSVSSSTATRRAPPARPSTAPWRSRRSVSDARPLGRSSSPTRAPSAPLATLASARGATGGDRASSGSSSTAARPTARPTRSRRVSRSIARDAAAERGLRGREQRRAAGGTRPLRPAPEPRHRDRRRARSPTLSRPWTRGRGSARRAWSRCGPTARLQQTIRRFPSPGRQLGEALHALPRCPACAPVRGGGRDSSPTTRETVCRLARRLVPARPARGARRRRASSTSASFCSRRRRTGAAASRRRLGHPPSPDHAAPSTTPDGWRGPTCSRRTATRSCCTRESTLRPAGRSLSRRARVCAMRCASRARAARPRAEPDAAAVSGGMARAPHGASRSRRRPSVRRARPQPRGLKTGRSRLDGLGSPRHELAVPELEHEQRPDARRLAVRAGRVAVEQAADASFAEAAAPERAGVEQDLARPGAQLAAQPVADRDREALLGPVEDVVRQPAAQRLAQDPLLLAARAPSARPGSRRRAPSARGRGTASAPRARGPSSRCRSSRSGRRAGRSRCRPRASRRRTASPGRGLPTGRDDSVRRPGRRRGELGRVERRARGRRRRSRRSGRSARPGSSASEPGQPARAVAARLGDVAAGRAGRRRAAAAAARSGAGSAVEPAPPACWRRSACSRRRPRRRRRR